MSYKKMTQKFLKAKASKIWEIAENLYRGKKDGFARMIYRKCRENKCREFFLIRSSGRWVHNIVIYRKEDWEIFDNSLDGREEISYAVQQEKEMNKYKSHMDELISHTIDLLEL